MFRNYLKIAIRGLLTNKAFSALNILGLSIGMGVALIIGLWVYEQYSFDRFLDEHEQVYQVRRNFYGNGDTVNYGGTSLKLANALRTQVPGIEYVAETDGFGMHGLMAGGKKFYLNGGQVGTDFLRIFSYPFVAGNAITSLRNPYSIVLTQSTATALFGTENPMNKVVRIDNKNHLVVTGVLKDLPANSTLQFTYLVPFSYLEATDSFVNKARTAGFGWTNFMTFVKLKPGITYNQAEPTIKNLQKSETDNTMSMATNIMLNPVQKWHLYEKFENGKATGGMIDYVRIFSIIGILVLLIACINFINLTTARSQKRVKEVGVRKSIGSGQGQLVAQFLTESLLLTFLAFVISLLLVQTVIPVFNHLAGSGILIPYNNYSFWLIVIICVLVTGIVAGGRPAFYLSSFDPVKALKGNLKAGPSAAFSRKILVVAQFSCSIALIIATIIIYQQVNYAKDRPVGYDKTGLVTTDMNADLQRNYTVIKNELLASRSIGAVTTASVSVTRPGTHRDVEQWPGKHPNESVDMGMITVSGDYFSTLGMHINQGRDFGAPADSMNVVLNAAAVKLMRLTDPLNQVITHQGHPYRIIGIVNDALTGSPFNNADPTIFFYDTKPQDVILYKLAANTNPHDAIRKLASIFNRYNPSFPFSYSFTDETYAAKFRFEELIGTLAGLFAGLAILISCLGLLGLAAYMAEQRKKEIGIRKVLGATITQLWFLLSKDFMVLVLISCGIASAIAYWYMQGWLAQYNYRITVSPLVYIASAAGAILLTIAVTSFQAIRTAIANPVKSLKTE